MSKKFRCEEFNKLVKTKTKSIMKTIFPVMTLNEALRKLLLFGKYYMFLCLLEK